MSLGGEGGGTVLLHCGGTVWGDAAARDDTVGRSAAELRLEKRKRSKAAEMGGN